MVPCLSRVKSRHKGLPAFLSPKWIAQHMRARKCLFSETEFCGLYKLPPQRWWC